MTNGKREMKEGFSLIEMIIAIAIMAIVMSAILLLMTFSSANMRRTTNMVDLQNESKDAVMHMTTYIQEGSDVHWDDTNKALVVSRIVKDMEGNAEKIEVGQYWFEAETAAPEGAGGEGAGGEGAGGEGAGGEGAGGEGAGGEGAGGEGAGGEGAGGEGAGGEGAGGAGAAVPGSTGGSIEDGKRGVIKFYKRELTDLTGVVVNGQVDYTKLYELTDGTNYSHLTGEDGQKESLLFIRDVIGFGCEIKDNNVAESPDPAPEGPTPSEPQPTFNIGGKYVLLKLKLKNSIGDAEFDNIKEIYLRNQ
ncbi:MAG: prepilin-type N-terminal cleavage/methylation domain-containing protein [Eubacterium sp.]|nr:prepilin-type N-terminal cleavage/methylation domain-containing protein [Eubacterium sp.]